VLYVTERCVLRLGPEGLELIEIAPGLDLEADVLAHMAFRPVVVPELRRMDPALFRDAPPTLGTARLPRAGGLRRRTRPRLPHNDLDPTPS
jgi:propionate CoA-transferase